MKRITSASVFSDSVGLRLSATWSEIDENTGLIVSDNRRFDRVITDEGVAEAARAVLEHAAQSLGE